MSVRHYRGKSPFSRLEFRVEVEKSISWAGYILSAQKTHGSPVISSCSHWVGSEVRMQTEWSTRWLCRGFPGSDMANDSLACEDAPQPEAVARCHSVCVRWWKSDSAAASWRQSAVLWGLRGRCFSAALICKAHELTSGCRKNQVLVNPILGDRQGVGQRILERIMWTISHDKPE